jgi:ubiquinone/menaquinone biosynthesis C-methylase UbiE
LDSDVKIEDAYRRWSQTYDSDRNLTRDLDQRATYDELSTNHYETILELGCGTGKNTTLLGKIGKRVLALDFSLGMIKRAQAKVLVDHMIFAVADLTRPWPCPSNLFELIVCNLVLEHVHKLTPVFSEAYRVLSSGGQFFISELHPYRQYQGKQATFEVGDETIQIPAFTHHLSDFTNSAALNGLSLRTVKEWWDENDQEQPPRLISFLFEKSRNPSV